MASDEATTKLSPAEITSLLHFSSYGYPSSSSATRVLKDERQTESTFSQPQTCAWRAPLPRSSIPRLINGFSPQQMEHKWFVYSEGPTAPNKEAGEGGKLVVLMHRSWTGKKIYELQVELVEGLEGVGTVGSTEEVEKEREKEIGGWITGLNWETDEEIITGLDEERAKQGVREVCRWVLGFELGEDE